MKTLKSYIGRFCLSLFLTNFQIFYFHGYSFLSLVCVRINLMVLLSHLPFFHFTKEKHVSNSGQSSPWCVVSRYKYLLDIKETIGNIGVDIEKIYYFNDVITNPFVNQVQLALSIHRCETCRLWRADCSFLMPYLKKNQRRALPCCHLMSDYI